MIQQCSSPLGAQVSGLCEGHGAEVQLIHNWEEACMRSSLCTRCTLGRERAVTLRAVWDTERLNYVQGPQPSLEYSPSQVPSQGSWLSSLCKTPGSQRWLFDSAAPYAESAFYPSPAKPRPHLWNSRSDSSLCTTVVLTQLPALSLFLTPSFLSTGTEYHVCLSPAWSPECTSSSFERLFRHHYSWHSVL